MAGYVGTKAVLLSTTAANVGGDADIGGALDVGGGLTVDNDGSTVLTVDRATSDGAIIDVQKSGSSVGSIGVHSSSVLYAGTGDTGIAFQPAFDVVIPFNPSTNDNRDNAVSLGANYSRFKDLYLSGGVFLGGTGSANHLDDYEEGTWTPADGAGAGLTIQINHASYTKIGRVVHVKAYITIPSNSSGAAVRISGLPFTNTPNNGWCPALLTTNGSVSGTRFIRARSNEASLDVGTSEGDVSKAYSDYSQKWMIFSLTYSTT